MCRQAFRQDSCIKILIFWGKPIAWLTRYKLDSWNRSRSPSPLDCWHSNQRTSPLCWAFGVFFIFSSEGGIILSMNNCCNVFSLLSSGFLCKPATKRKKSSSKIFTRTNFIQIFQQVVSWHIRKCQHSIQGGGTIMTYAYISTEHSMGSSNSSTLYWQSTLWHRRM